MKTFISIILIVVVFSVFWIIYLLLKAEEPIQEKSILFSERDFQENDDYPYDEEIYR